MFKKIVLASLLITPELLVSAENQIVPDKDQQRYSQNASGDGMVQATQPEVVTQPEEVNNSDDDDDDFAVVPQG